MLTKLYIYILIKQSWMKSKHIDFISEYNESIVNCVELADVVSKINDSRFGQTFFVLIVIISFSE